MTIFIKARIQKSERHIKNDKYRVAAYKVLENKITSEQNEHTYVFGLDIYRDALLIELKLIFL